jgi:hypothetical protein
MSTRLHFFIAFIVFSFGRMDAARFIRKFLVFISHNVPAVYDVFAARIRACVARPGLQKCGGGLAWE